MNFGCWMFDEKKGKLCDLSRKKVFSLLGGSDEGKLVAGGG